MYEKIGHRQTLGAHLGHGGALPYVQCTIEGGEGDDRRRRGDECLHPVGRFVAELEIKRSRVTEPSRQWIAELSLPGLSNVEEGRGAGTAVQVLVPAARREVDVGPDRKSV